MKNLAISALLAGALALTACGKKEEQAAEPTPAMEVAPAPAPAMEVAPAPAPAMEVAPAPAPAEAAH